MKKWQALLASSMTLFALTACGGDDTKQAEQTTQPAVEATDTTKGEVKKQSTMQTWDDTMKNMGDIMRNPDGFDPVAFQKEVKTLTDTVDKPWKKLSAKHDSPEFQAEIEKYKAAVNELNTASQNASSMADVIPAVDALGNNCMSCHMVIKK